MRFAIIDLGTNTARLDIHQLSLNGSKLILRKREMVRLGESVFISGMLSRAATERTLGVLVRFRKICQQEGVAEIYAFGTSALREAKDRAQFIKNVRIKTGITLSVLSGSREAQLIAEGVLQNDLRCKGSFVLVDIGGGSTEVSVCYGKKVIESHSIRLGTARIQKKYLKTNPPSKSKSVREKKLLETRKLIARRLHSRFPAPRKLSRIFGSSGTARILARIVHADGEHALSNDDLDRIVEKMLPLNLKALKALAGMDYERADMILAGAILLREIMSYFKIATALPTPYALRDGVLIELLRKKSVKKLPRLRFR